MKTLIVMRHGHAEDADDDYARSLSAHGEQAAFIAGTNLHERGIQLDYVLSSSAPRAVNSARSAALACQFSGEIVTHRQLYLASVDVHMRILQALPENASTVLLVGHNPGLSALVVQLSGQPCTLSPAQYVVLSLELASFSD